MRTIEEQNLALECLKLAQGDIDHAGKMLAFLRGDAEQAAKDLLEHIHAITRS